MSDNIEIVMDIDSLEIFDVIDLKENENIVDFVSEGNSEEKVSPYDDLDRVWLINGYYYKSSSLLWEVIKIMLFMNCILEINMVVILTTEEQETEHGDNLAN